MQQTIDNLPISAGVYQYFSENGTLLYIGKAKNLKNRVRSYFKFTPNFRINDSLTHRIQRMLSESVRLEYIVVESEEDALILENSLIKQLKPKYNILLRDDKTYPYIYIDETQPFARFEITRKVIDKKNISYYGPFPTGARDLLSAIYEIYPLVQKKGSIKGKKACLYYQIKKCLAPCEGKVEVKEYQNLIDSAKNDIKNRKNLISKLEKRMLFLAESERFEEAGVSRDMIKSISSLSISSRLDLASNINLDIFAILKLDDRGVVVKLFMRDGKIISRTVSYFRETHIFEINEAYKQVLLEFYLKDNPYVPKEILVANDFEDKNDMANIISKKLGKQVSIKNPKIGSKKRLIDIAIKNAEELLRVKDRDFYVEQDVANLFNLSRIPYRVETFDNSHLQGVAIVGGMVVWDNNNWDKKSYRRYALTSRDETGQTKELLKRRVEKFEDEGSPDLWILDGGKANLNIAYKILEQKGINLDVMAIAKEKIDSKAHRAKGFAKDIIYTKDNIFKLDATDRRLQWVQRHRDEAHRYAIKYHQEKKRLEDKDISLLSKKGVAIATIRRLLNYFGTFEAIEKASYDEIKKVTNVKVADSLKNR